MTRDSREGTPVAGTMEWISLQTAACKVLRKDEPNSEIHRALLFNVPNSCGKRVAAQATNSWNFCFGHPSSA
eukprot:7700182-Pyramimonas_sp.AAC.1